MPDTLAIKAIKKFEQMRSDRARYERDWRDIRDFIRPSTPDFSGQNYSGRSLVDPHKVFDGTAKLALEELAGGLHAYLTTTTDRWFNLGIENFSVEDYDDESLLWLELVADEIYSEYARSRSHFHTSLHETYMDLCGFGTGVLNQELSGGVIRFRSFSLANCFIEEDHDGMVDTIVRQLQLTTRQVVGMFDKESDYIPKKVREDTTGNKIWIVIQAVFPREQRRYVSFTAQNMPYTSVWILVDTKEVLRESGYSSFPYHVPRWVKLADEVYGYGPSANCLPDVRMLNKMEFTLLKAGEKITDPPLVVEEEGIMIPFETSPNAIIFKERGSESPEPLECGKGLPFGIEQANQKREFIKQCFYSDYLKMGKEKIEMTAYEVADRREEKLRELAPMLGRCQDELLGPMIGRTYSLLKSLGRIEQSPGMIHKQRLKVEYVSPAAKAQVSVKATTMGRYIQDIIPLAQINPAILDAVDLDAYARELAIARGTTRKILRSVKDIAKIRDERMRQQQMQQLAEVAEPASRAVKNIADANKSMPLV